MPDAAPLHETKRLARPFELKALDEKGTFSGYGSVFHVTDSYLDIVMPGAFKASLEKRTPKLLWQHDTRTPIGVWTSAKEDDHGLYLEGKLVMEVEKAREAHALMKAGALDGLSIGFRTVRYEYDQKTDVRKLLEVELYEVSPVTFPACEPARIDAVKSAGPAQLKRHLEEALRDAGLSRKEAMALLADGFKALGPRDADDEKAAFAEAIQQFTNEIRGAQWKS